MPFKIPRLDIKFSSQRELSFTQDSTSFFSEIDSIGNNYCSQNSRDSAIDSSQTDKYENGGFWMSIRGSNDNPTKTNTTTRHTSYDSTTVFQIIDDISGTITEIDSLITKFNAENLGDNDAKLFYSKLEEMSKMLSLGVEYVMKSFSQTKELISRISGLQNSLKKILSLDLSLKPSHLRHSSYIDNLIDLKMRSFTSHLDFMVDLAQKQIECANVSTSRLPKNDQTFLTSPRVRHIATRRKFDCTPLEFSSGRVRFPNHNMTSLLDSDSGEPGKQIPKFSINFCNKITTVSVSRTAELSFNRQGKPNVRRQALCKLAGSEYWKTCKRTGCSSAPPKEQTMQSDSITKDIFYDSSNDNHDELDDDDFSSFSEDCISLNSLLLEVEE